MIVKKIHKNIGVSIEGIDLSNLDDSSFQKIKKLWLEHLVIIFPNQNISDEDHIKFGKRFGDLEVHPSLSHRSSKNPEIYRVSNVDENGDIIPNKETSWQYLKQSWLWHTDSSFRKIPSNGSILHGISTTNEGGNTLFANMYKAYEDLDQSLKNKIKNLKVIHDHDYIISLSNELSKRKNKGNYDKLDPVIHPLVRRHPSTKKPSLFLSPHTMVNIKDYDNKKGRELLDQLIDHATQPHYVYKHSWNNHDIVMWDNRCTMHSVEPFDNNNIKRIMHRVTLVGDLEPIMA
ncbi:MAG: TauD/TfdA dioxygenase family protein [Alphaproteobacteria bacterium]